MTILLVRAHRNDVDEQACTALGIATLTDPYLTISAFFNPDGVARMRSALTSQIPTLLIATSTNALPFFDQALYPGELHTLIRSNPHLSFAAVGAHTERQLMQYGADKVLRGDSSDSESLFAALTSSALVNPLPQIVVIPSGSIAMQGLTNRLRQAGCKVVSEVVYTTAITPHVPRSVDHIQRGEITGVVFRSPSAARAFVHYNGIPQIDVFCAGTTTASQTQELGLTVSAVSASPQPEVLAQTIWSHTESKYS